MSTIILAFSILLAASPGWAECVKTEQLFAIARSKNNNIVRYDYCIDGSGALSDATPVIAYWVLENGKREDLNGAERKHAYGIILREKTGKDRVVISLASMQTREIAIEKTGDRYRAIMTIDGKESFIERIFVKSHEILFGLPVVDFIEFFGRTKAENLPVYEKVVKP